MHVEDARAILQDVLEYEVVDSLLDTYKERDKLNSDIIMFNNETIGLLKQKNVNLEEQISNLKTIDSNKDSEIAYKDDTIKQQKKEIKKQKFLKTVGFAAAVILPILVLFAK
jgi:hypothetical protein